MRQRERTGEGERFICLIDSILCGTIAIRNFRVVEWHGWRCSSGERHDSESLARAKLAVSREHGIERCRSRRWRRRRNEAEIRRVTAAFVRRPFIISTRRYWCVKGRPGPAGLHAESRPWKKLLAFLVTTSQHGRHSAQSHCVDIAARQRLVTSIRASLCSVSIIAFSSSSAWSGKQIPNPSATSFGRKQKLDCGISRT